MSSSRKNALSAQCHADLSAAPARTIKESLLDAVKTGENAVIAECVSRIMRYVFNERK